MKFLNALGKVLIFGIFLLLLLFLIRVGFILYVGVYSRFMGDVGFYEAFKYLFVGLIYDRKFIALIVLIYFCLTIIALFIPIFKRLLGLYANITFVLCLFFGISEMVFYQIYGDIFNTTLLNLFYDDTIAIIKTGLSGGYNIITKVIIWIIISSIYCMIFQKIIKIFDAFTTKAKTISIPLLSLGSIHILFLVLLVSTPLPLDEMITPSKDIFLKRTRHNFLGDLHVLFLNIKNSTTAKNLVFPVETELKIAQNYFNLKTTPSAPLDIYPLLSHTSSNTSKTKIKHIFYIISESFSDWAFNPIFDKIGLTSGLKSLIDNKHGFKLSHFLENAPCTTRSLGIQLTGLPQTDYMLFQLIGSFSSFLTAPAEIFNKLGYEGNFYYGGISSWGRFGRVATEEGFANTYDEMDVIGFAKGKKYQKHITNEWGVHDNVLFDFIKQNITQASKPTFNMIMTSSVHAPYNVELDYFNVPLKEIEAFLDKYFPPQKRTHGMDANILGHIWWYDKQVTHFIKEISKLYPDSLFVITADHYGRISPIPSNKPHINYTVPFILYSPTLTPKQLANIGSHIDITPTIVELVAPKDFEYHNFGSPLFSNNHTLPFEPNRTALGYQIIGNQKFLYTQDFGIEYLINPPSIQEKQSDENSAKQIYQKLEELNNLSLYLLIKGNIIK